MLKILFPAFMRWVATIFRPGDHDLKTHQGFTCLVRSTGGQVHKCTAPNCPKWQFTPMPLWKRLFIWGQRGKC